MWPVAKIESSIVERIRSARLPYLRFVGSYGGELMGDWQEVVRAVPAVWVAFAGSAEPAPKNTANTRFVARLTYSTIVAARSVRSEEACRRGGPASVGSYRMLDDVATLLCMQDFGLDGVDYLRPGRVRSLFSAKIQGQALSVFSQEWSASVVIQLREPGQRALGTETADAYLPPEGQTFPGAAHARNPAPLPKLRDVALRYWLKPPQDMETDPPLLEDRITLNIRI